jgi:LAGLIDADG endonuclease
MARTPGGNAAIESRLRAAQGLSASDSHALAGFIDAEGSFVIVPNNGGTTWSCGMTLALRLDDADVLRDLCRSTGLGRILLTRPQRGSRPQARWNITSKRECLQLTRLLRRFPLRARKRRDFKIWSQAVDRWAASPYDAGRDRDLQAEMARAAERLRHVRRYVKSGPAAFDGPAADVLAYFGGFFSGEGCFGLSGLAPRAVIKVRRDDRSILELFAEHFGLGAVTEQRAYENPNPSATWLICATDELAPAVELFEAADLRGRKRREFEVWREAAHERAFAKVGGRPWDRSRVKAVAERLTALRVYRPPPDPLGATDVSDPRSEARSAYLQVLQAFAAEAPEGELTATTYARARERHPEWPTRNTIAAAFGGWARALEAAGLGSRVTDRARSRARRA